MLLSMFAACNNDPIEGPNADPDDQQQEEINSDPAEPEEPVDTRVRVEQWLANEIEFASSVTYDDPVYTVNMDVVFTNKTTGKTFTMPAFWDGGTNWKVRYALTELGEWTWTTSCTDETNTGLNGLSGEVVCVEYSGDLAIYKHGFLKTVPGTLYLMYADGTPFFYLGDTHWTLPMEDIDGINPKCSAEHLKISQETADQYGITSMFKHIIDYRAEQGFTVIQSQQLHEWNSIAGVTWLIDENGSVWTSGINETIVSKLKELDRYFAYIAEKGFVHAHSQFSYPEELIKAALDGLVTDEQIETLCRYWVARYAAYPVIWTTAQEIDNDFGEYYGCTPLTNPGIQVMESVAKYDPYDHISTAHQERSNRTDRKLSIFDDSDCYGMYAMQNSLEIILNKTISFSVYKGYYNNPKGLPTVNYEGAYDHFWASEKRSRAQGWTAFLNGAFGYGYGSQPIWSLGWAAGGDDTYVDDIEEFPTRRNWLEGLYSAGSDHVVYMKNFLEQYEWWNLVPCFAAQTVVATYYANDGKAYSAATIGNELYIAYLYGNDETVTDYGTFLLMENADYNVRWFDPQTGEYTDLGTVTITDGTYKIPVKPTTEDWVIVAELVK